jgi:hypothetical protein
LFEVVRLYKKERNIWHILNWKRLLKILNCKN